MSEVQRAPPEAAENPVWKAVCQTLSRIGGVVRGGIVSLKLIIPPVMIASAPALEAQQAVAQKPQPEKVAEKKFTPLSTQEIEQHVKKLEHSHYPNRKTADDKLRKGLDYDGMLHVATMAPVADAEVQKRKQEIIHSIFPKAFPSKFPLSPEIAKHYFYLEPSFGLFFSQIPA
ncbi:MAG: hypothetical protein HOO67_04970, partial [Candidatus Peribacteraceae bacterium]|nr:hypothetical protein [Candidatus Peribacteraceae bacterium]